MSANIGQNLRYTDGTAQGTTMHSPNNARETGAMGVARIMKDTASS
jgi:hypothetical protein